MSMILEWFPVPPEELARLLTLDDEGLVSFLEASGASFDVDKAWHGVHAVLTGTAWDTDHELAGVVLGGTEFGDDLGYGPARYLTAEEVATLAARLEHLDVGAFRDRVDLQGLAALDIYPDAWDEGDEAIDWLTESFQIVRQGYLDAAAQGRAMVLCLF